MQFDTADLTIARYQIILSVFVNNQWQQKDVEFIDLKDTLSPSLIFLLFFEFDEIFPNTKNGVHTAYLSFVLIYYRTVYLTGLCS